MKNQRLKDARKYLNQAIIDGGLNGEDVENLDDNEQIALAEQMQDRESYFSDTLAKEEMN